MMKRTFPMLLVAWALACDSDVDLELDFESDTEPPTDSPTDPPPDPPPDSLPSVGQPAWSQTDLGSQGAVHDVAWTSDGELVATVSAGRVNETGELEPAMLLVRYRADGTLRWEVERDDGAHFSDVAATAQSGAVVAINPDQPDWNEESSPAGLDWYDADGTLTLSWRLDATETNDKLRELNAVQALPDGGVVWAGKTLSVDEYDAWTAVAGRLDPEGNLLWVIPVASIRTIDGFEPTDLAVTPDGGILLLAGYLEESGDEEWSWSSYVVRFEPDGTESWRTKFDGNGTGNGIAVAASGNVVVAGNFEYWMALGDFRLEEENYNGHHQFAAELDPDGQPIGLSRLEVPASIVSPDEIGVIADAMTMDDGQLMMAGIYYTNSCPCPEPPNGYYVAANRLDDGTLMAENFFPVKIEDENPGLFIGRVAAAATTSEGRLAIAGAFSGRVDFGDGEVESGKDPYGFPLAKPFIVVLDPASDVD